MNLVVIFFIWIFIHSFCNQLIAKNNSNAFADKGKAAYFLYTCLCTVCACIFFFITSGFHIECNLPTFLYALLYGSSILVGYLIGLHIYKTASVARIIVASSALNTPVVFLSGILLFSETVTLLKVGSVLLMVIAVFLSAKSGDDGSNHDGNLKQEKKKYSFISLLLLSVGQVVFNNILVKCYTLDTRVCSENSLFFMVNLLMLIFGLAGFLRQWFINRQEVKEFCSKLRAKDYILTTIRTIGDNITSLVSIWILVKVDLSIYTVLSASLGLLSAVGASLILKEKVTPRLWLALIFSIAAIILNVL